MYPLNMTNGAGYAVANDSTEHAALSACGYGPKFAASQDDKPQSSPTVGAEVQSDAAPIKRKPGRPRKE